MAKNNSFKIGFIWTIALICISGCSDSKTVDYYYNHQLEARKKIKECQKNEEITYEDAVKGTAPIRVKSSETCMNAIQAVKKWVNTMNAN